MKKFYAILLSLALVLGFVSVASASTSVVGKLELLFDDNIEANTWVLSPDIARFEIKGSASLFDDTFTAGAKVRLNPLSTTTVQLRDWNVNYKLSDAFSIGAVYYCTTDLFYLFDGPITNVSLVNQWAKGAFTFEGGSATLYSSLVQDDIDFAGAATYGTEDFGVTAAVANDKSADATDFFATGFYKFGDIKAEAEVVTGDSSNTLVGGKVSYGTEDTFIIGAGFQFDADASEVVQVVGDFTMGKFYAEGSYTLNTVEPIIYLYGEYALDDNLLVWAEYDKDANIALNELQVGLAISF